ncbi:unnamed protein product [Ceutorhynchus assimilis]|uniref:Myb/SANT-like DNA-binding domain-containing protein n=1 Tax=Ceutorhynchus assimilis TaxID=467358 RepID=A0A9N9QJ54_9CUCU|nr:unnamed protein product [Ceutorhynchus assimilis]
MDVEGVDFGSHGIIYVTQEKEKPTVTEWTNSATELLLKILKKHYQTHSNDGKFGSKRLLYENCSIAMKKKGLRYTAPQCENKWKSLKRRFLTNKRSATGKGKRRIPRKQMFDDEIEFLLQYVHPQFKKEPEDGNSTGGFDEEMDQDEENHEENEMDEPKYTQTDEEFVQRMLKGSDDEDQKDNVLAENIHYVVSPQPKLEASSVETPKVDNLIVNEVKELTNVMRNSMTANTDLLKSHGASYEQILVCMDSLDRKADERIEIEKKMLEQKKIQNTLLAKIVQRLSANNGSFN